MMRQSLAQTLLATALFAAAPLAHAVPVYLKVESRFPSGHYPRQWLESRMSRVQFQRWLRVETKDHAFGWLPENDLVTALKLASEAALTEDLPVRLDMAMDAIQSSIITEGTRVQILETQGSWAKVRTIAGGRQSWVPSESLDPALNVPAAKVFATRGTPIFMLPGLNAKIQSRLPQSKFLQFVRETSSGWIEVRATAGTGFLRNSDAVTLEDLAKGGARTLTDLAPMRSAPLPYADLVRSLPAGSRLRIIGAQNLRWGLTKVREIGEVWWPIHQERDEEREMLALERLTTRDLFNRKIFDMASSPAIPSLKVVSAQGVYRTVNGHDWTKIALFQDKNYPIAIAGQGSIFVGPYISDDHGETFNQWIRWDSLLSTLRHHRSGNTGEIRILEIKPQDTAGRRVLLKLNFGQGGKPVSLLTDDQGISWRPMAGG